MIRNDDELQSLMFLGWDVFLKRACAMDTACGERPWKTTQYNARGTGQWHQLKLRV